MKRTEDFLNKNYLDYVSSILPKTKEVRSLLRAFLVGGFICTVGQSIKFILQFGVGLEGDQLSAFTSMIMVFLGAFLTGIGVYDRIGKFAGCGSIVPITGFANSVVSPSMEFKSEGYVYGTASKMFTIAGPIIVFGTASSVLVGLIYYIVYAII
jgi:stage V sporulation protein AC